MSTVSEFAIHVLRKIDSEFRRANQLRPLPFPIPSDTILLSWGYGAIEAYSWVQYWIDAAEAGEECTRGMGRDLALWAHKSAKWEAL